MCCLLLLLRRQALCFWVLGIRLESTNRHQFSFREVTESYTTRYGRTSLWAIRTVAVTPKSFKSRSRAFATRGRSG